MSAWPRCSYGGSQHTSISGLSIEDGIGGVSSLPFSTNSSGGLGGGSVNITTLEGSGGSGLLGGLLLDLLGVSVEEEIGKGVPLSSGDLALESEDLSGEEVPHQTDRVSGLVVGGDGDVNELEVGVSVTEGNDAILSVIFGIILRRCRLTGC